MMTDKKNMLLIGCAMWMAGCTPEYDMQGHNSHEYYAKHPIENTVEARYLTHMLHFKPYHSDLDEDQLQSLKQHVSRISPLAVSTVEIQVHPSQLGNKERQDYLKHAFPKMGVSAKQLQFVALEEIGRHDAAVQIAYSVVNSPRCPDWRPSGVTSYTNMLFTPNFGCANTVNLGLMVADP